MHTISEKAIWFRHPEYDPIWLKSWSVRPCPNNCQHAKCHPNPCTRFWVILLTERQTDRQTLRAIAFTSSVVGGKELIQQNITSIYYYYRPSLLVSLIITRSSAVSERPRDASCLSVVSFNSTTRRVQSSVINHFGFNLALSTFLLFSLAYSLMHVIATCVLNSSLSLVVASHLVLEVFTWQLLLFEIVSSLTSVLTKLSQHSANTWNLIFSIQSFPLPTNPSQCLWFVHIYGTL